MLRQYFNCNEKLEIFLICFCNILCYVSLDQIYLKSKLKSNLKAPRPQVNPNNDKYWKNQVEKVANVTKQILPLSPYVCTRDRAQWAVILLYIPQRVWRAGGISYGNIIYLNQFPVALSREVGKPQRGFVRK